MTIARASLLSAGQLASYDTIKNIARSQGKKDGPALHLFASICSAICAQTICMPADTLKSRLMAAQRNPASSSVASVGRIARELIQRHGVTGLFRGYVPAITRQVPIMAIQMPVVEQLRIVFGLTYF